MATISIRVNKEDYEKLKNDCVEKLFEEKPDLQTLNKKYFSIRGMFKRLVKFYLEEPQEDDDKALLGRHR